MEEGSVAVARVLVRMEEGLGGVKRELEDIWHLVQEVAREGELEST